MNKARLNEIAKMRDAAAVKTGNAGVTGKNAVKTYLYRQSDTNPNLYRLELEPASSWITENEMLTLTTQPGKSSTPRLVIINSYVHQIQPDPAQFINVQ